MTKEFIRRYFQGKLNDEEQRLMKQWIGESGPAWMDDYLDSEWNHAALVTSQKEKDRMAGRVLDAVSNQDEQSAKPPVIYMPRRKKYASWIAAASLAAIVVLSFFYLNRPSEKPLNWQTYRNDQAGTVKMLRLPDSSVAYLNAFSSLSIPDDFNDTARQLRLEGEAFFEVTHDLQRPFRVLAGAVTTRVYGTAFNVSAYPGSDQLRVALKQGSIGIKTPAQPEQMMTPGHLLIYTQADSSVKLHQLPAANIGGWTGGELDFYNTSFKDALASLERKYGVVFECTAGLKERTITAKFQKVSLDQVLQHLSFVWNIRFEKKNGKVYAY